MKKKISENQKITLTLSQLKKLVQESKFRKSIGESLQDNGGTKYIVRSYQANSIEDTYEDGEIGKIKSSWSQRDLPVDGEFNSIGDALKAVCDENYYDFNKDNWEFDEVNNEFFTDILVDEVDDEASEKQIEEWKNGEEKLWNCHLCVHIVKIQELNDTDMSSW